MQPQATFFNIHSGFAFLITHVNVRGELPIEVIPRHIFRKARPSEIEIIEHHLNKLLASAFRRWPSYNAKVVIESQNENSSSFRFEELPVEQWKYWVIAYEGSVSAVHTLTPAASLLDPEIEFGFEIFFSEPDQRGKVVGYSSMPLHLTEAYSSADVTFRQPFDFDVRSFDRIRELAALERALADGYDFIKHAFQNFSAIRQISHTSEFRAVGYFSVIEALITHTPRSNETLDSISHQVRNKAVLLRKRFERPINPCDHFAQTDERKIWNDLYSYRSCLAHGGVADFEAGFKKLKNQDHVQRFLREFIKELLILSLKEPDFVKDLKAC